MSITIVDQTPYSELVSVTVDDDCDHAGAEVEMVEYSMDSWCNDIHGLVNDDTEELLTLICKCGFEEIQESEQ